MDVSPALKESLAELGWSATKAAAEIGVTARTMESLLAGGVPSGPTLYALLKDVPGFAQRLLPDIFRVAA
jgi:hypothetical protein